MSAPTTARNRLDSIDALRGAVMIIMALDHLRDFLHAAAFVFSPENLARTTPAIFFTRWITHFCAPVFMFTAGLGAFLVYQRLGDQSALSRYLWKRGLWLIVLELIAVRLAFAFSLTEGLLVLEVLWALGWSMILLGGLVRLPMRVLAILSVAVICLHNALDPVQGALSRSLGWVWNVLHQPGVIPPQSPVLLLAYPLIPWFAVMSAGFCFGSVMVKEPEVRQRWMVRMGTAATVAFVVLRMVNIYGNPAPWSSQGSAVMTVVSFLNVLKYPPSLDFLLMTLGPALLALSVLDRMRFRPLNPLLVFGRVPLFYFLLHLYLIHLLAVVLALIRYGQAAFLFHPLPSMGGPAELYPAGYGYSLPAVYAAWIGLVAALYPVCVWYGRLKSTRRSWWLRYL
ncbi:MAG: heparan-alpha-glucosaminide N-acetyltransferase domain-containing protein [Paludibaculum sp.]